LKRISLVEHEDATEAGRLTAEVVREGGVVLFPTETFYGLGADPHQPEAVARVFAMKDRPGGLALSVLCSDWAQVEELAQVPEEHRVKLSRIWPGPLTAVMRCRHNLAVAPAGTIGVRILGHALMRAVLYRAGPLTGTSANRHGQPPSTDADSALASLVVPPDLVLDGGRTEGVKPTTVVDLTGADPHVVRPGGFAWEEPYPWE
jgi:L-threonylcarbamoyladenylate synthase